MAYKLYVDEFGLGEYHVVADGSWKSRACLDFQWTGNYKRMGAMGIVEVNGENASDQSMFWKECVFDWDEMIHIPVQGVVQEKLFEINQNDARS